MRDYNEAPTDKQLRLIEALAKKLGRSGGAWHQFHMSASAAQRRATRTEASALIDELQQELAKREAKP